MVKLTTPCITLVTAYYFVISEWSYLVTTYENQHALNGNAMFRKVKERTFLDTHPEHSQNLINSLLSQKIDSLLYLFQKLHEIICSFEYSC